MECIYCKSKYPYVVKNGRDRLDNQRYKCQNCGRTFSTATIQRLIVGQKKRLVLHLILAGCKSAEIAEELAITEKIILRWKKLHLKEINEILPDKPLLATHTLNVIYKAIEKRRIAEILRLHRRQKNRRGL